MAFTPDSTRIAAWAASPNRTTLWLISDGTVLKQFPVAAAEEGVGAIRFTPDGARLVTTGYLPYVDADGLWQQVGVIRFWRVADGALRHSFSKHTGIGVTSPVAWSPDVMRFAYGTYGGTAVVALTPAPYRVCTPAMPGFAAGKHSAPAPTSGVKCPRAICATVLCRV